MQANTRNTCSIVPDNRFFYDFEYHCPLQENEFSSLFFGYESCADVSGVGIRVFQGECAFDSPLLVAEINTIFFKAPFQAPQSLQDDLSQVFTGVRRIFKIQTDIQDTVEPIFPDESRYPKVAINLPDIKACGRGVNIGIVDDDITENSEKPEFQHYFDFSDGIKGRDHGKKIVTVLKSEAHSLVPCAQYTVANVSFESSAAAIIIGMVWLANRGVNLINVSRRVSTYENGTIPAALNRAVDYCIKGKKCLVIAATANWNNRACSALARLSDVMSVSCAISTDILNVEMIGEYKVDCVAFGEGIYTQNGLWPFVGASSATALATGATALVLEQDFQNHADPLVLKERFLRNYCFSKLIDTPSPHWGKGYISMENFSGVNS